MYNIRILLYMTAATISILLYYHFLFVKTYCVVMIFGFFFPSLFTLQFSYRILYNYYQNNNNYHEGRMEKNCFLFFYNNNFFSRHRGLSSPILLYTYSGEWFHRCRRLRVFGSRTYVTINAARQVIRARWRSTARSPPRQVPIYTTINLRCAGNRKGGRTCAGSIVPYSIVVVAVL